MIFEHRIHSNNNINYHNDNQQPLSSYLYSIFEILWPTSITKKKKKRPIGLQPHTAITIAQVHTVTEPITFDYREYDSCDDDDDYLSKSDSTLSSFGSSISSTSSSSNEDRRRRRSSIALSEILCEHYVQKHTNAINNEKSDVPLETFRTFEASTMMKDEESWFMGNTNPKQWVLVDELLLQKEQEVEKTRAIRTNSAHLRMIVAEVNMMRSNKIICPLKPRGFLSSRTDRFIPNAPSPLSSSLS